MVRAIVGVAAVLALAPAALAEERLVLEPYPGGTWVDVVNQRSGAAFIHEQIPQGQSPDTATDVLTAQSVPGFHGQPSEFIASAFTQFGQNCESVATIGPTSTEEQGRLVAYGRLYCGREKGQTYGAHIFFKAILGSDALYVVDRDFRTPSSDKADETTLPEDQAIAFLKAEAEATKYLTNQVYVCDPVFPDPKCDAATTPAGPP